MKLNELKVGQSITTAETEYQKDFKKKLDNWEVNSPAQLPEKEKPEFFDEVKDENFSTLADLKVGQTIVASDDIAEQIKKMGILRANGVLKSVIQGLLAFEGKNHLTDNVIKKLREAQALINEDA